MQTFIYTFINSKKQFTARNKQHTRNAKLQHRELEADPLRRVGKIIGLVYWEQEIDMCYVQLVCQPVAVLQYSSTVQCYSTVVQYSRTVQYYSTIVQYSTTVQYYSTVVQYSTTVQYYSTHIRTHKQYIKQHNNFERVRAVPRLG
jgi:hypothetical protein